MTAETAVVLPAVLAVLVLCLWAVLMVGQQVRCIDAARAGARALARGEPAELAESVARQAAPEGARVSIRVSGDTAVVEVRLTAGAPGPWAVGGIELGSRAVAAMEGQ